MPGIWTKTKDARAPRRVAERVVCEERLPKIRRSNLHVGIPLVNQCVTGTGGEGRGAELGRMNASGRISGHVMANVPPARGPFMLW